MISKNVSDFARYRLDLCSRERRRFRLPPQISLEILLLLAEQDGAAALNRIYEQIPAAEKSVRSHIRALIASRLVEEGEPGADRRAKSLRLTSRGAADLATYVEECDRARSGPAVRETFLPGAPT
jgi:DNA-binding MarR family transcriptional regulator